MHITTSYSAGRLIIHLSGELDHHGAREATRTIDNVLDRYMPRDCALDMSGVSFMDSSGIAVILKAERHMRETGGRCSIENPAIQAMRVIDASGIDRMVPVRGESR